MRFNIAHVKDKILRTGQVLDIAAKDAGAFTATAALSARNADAAFAARAGADADSKVPARAARRNTGTGRTKQAPP
jgi:hypothetical protein